MRSVLTPLTPAQRVALDWHLTAYDPSRTFDYICEQLRTEDKNVTVWEFLEGYPAEMLIDLIETLAAGIQDAVNKEKTNDQTYPGATWPFGQSLASASGRSY